MTLDDDLKSTFAREAGTQPAPPPDLVGMVRGGRVRRRRRTLERVGAGIAAAVVLGAGGYALVPDGLRDPGVTSRPPGILPPTTDSGRPPLADGTHRTFVGTDGTGRRIEADVTVSGDNWSGGDFPLVSDRFGSTFAGVGVYQPHAIAAGSGCLGDAVTSDLGRTPLRLAQQLARLPRGSVVDAPAPMRAFGHPGVHLRLQVRVQCPNYYRLAETPGGDRGITYAMARTAAEDVMIDFWILDVAGALVVVDEWHNIDASDSLVEQAARARTSIELVVE